MQSKTARTKPNRHSTLQDAYRLLHEGSLIMSRMEQNGIRVDTEYIRSSRERLDKQIKKLMEELKQDEVYKLWRRRYGEKMKFSARAQLTTVLFDDMKIPYPGEDRNASGSYQGDVEILEDVDLPFVETYLRKERLTKAKNTYIKNIALETINGICHPNFNLHLARTFRGSSDHPNFTNIPIRNPEIKKEIRSCLKARPGRRIVDLDFKGSEVNAATWYHEDPVMLDYIKKDPGRMHFDVAKDIYMLPSKLMTNDIRYCGKNKFTFPQFYGDWYLSCAKQLWKAIDRMHLVTSTGIPLKRWLKRKGIRELGDCSPDRQPRPGTFEEHIRSVERIFWNKRFKVYQEWKDEWWEQYQERGWMQFLSGFIVSGVLNRKNAINYPIQGTAFHCLLWCLIRIQYLLDKYKMKTLLIGQIHDDAVADVPEKELKTYIEITEQVITVDLKKHWPWIITPMQVSAEVTPIGGSWYEKKSYTA